MQHDIQFVPPPLPAQPPIHPHTIWATQEYAVLSTTPWTTLHYTVEVYTCFHTCKSAASAPECDIGGAYRCCGGSVRAVMADKIYGDGGVPTGGLQLPRALPPADRRHDVEISRVVYIPPLTCIRAVMH